MPMSVVEDLDAALEREKPSDADEIDALVVTAAEVRSVLAAPLLSAADRSLLYARIQDGARPVRLRLRLLTTWRVPALVGGGIVTAGAVAAVAVLVTRGRRGAQLPAAA
jgi:hypothetical protein